MAQRKKIALVYSNNTGWIAGTYYILNLINALGKIEDKDKPELTILSYTEDEFNDIRQTNYPYLKFFQLKEKDFWKTYSMGERIINKLSKMLFKKTVYYNEHTDKRLKLSIDLIFPAIDHVYFSEVKNKLFWIPDFQEYFLPHFFSKDEIEQRKKYQKKLVDNGSMIVFSSENALKHFKNIFPDSESRVFVLPFAVTHPIYQNSSIVELKNKYDIHLPYFFCPNQFWAHKNHITVLKALKKIIDQGRHDFLIVFSGKEFDRRNPEFMDQLKLYMKENGLENNIRSLGFIDRKEQLQLMNNAISVIQPSLFEGWSTVVEDAKAMGQHVIASDLEVHREQLQKNYTLFNPTSEDELMESILNLLKNNPIITGENDYETNILDFGTNFNRIVKQIIDN